MNWSVIGFIVLIWLIIIAFGMMLYFEYIDPLRRQAQWRREQATSTHTSYPDAHTTTWVLDTRFRELSDEEIKKVFAEETGFNFDDNPGDGMDLMGFARAVIRKAQER